MAKHSTITRLLHDYSKGDAAAIDRLAPIVYQQLRKMARAHFSKERSGNTLQPTAIVHEVFLKLMDAKSLQVADRAHFYFLAAQMMRRILINRAHARNRLKRGGGGLHISFDEKIHQVGGGEQEAEVLELDKALKKLALKNERQSRVVELRYFAGMSLEEAAQVLNCSVATIKRDWTYAKVWLYRELQRTK
jgi:RNA polymerase sigma-70 factor, ECF subfamily